MIALTDYRVSLVEARINDIESDLQYKIYGYEHKIYGYELTWSDLKDLMLERKLLKELLADSVTID